MKQILIIISSILLILAAIIVGCSKTTILNKVEVEQPAETKADTTEMETPAEDADTLHEITFNPVVEVWVISDGDTLKL